MSEEVATTSTDLEQGKTVLGWRKFVSFLVVIIATTGLTYLGKIESDHYSDVTVWAMVIFFASNVSQHLGDSLSKRLSVRVSTEEK